MITAEDRGKTYDKCNGHCAYCGAKLEFDEMQIDHIIPINAWDQRGYNNQWDVDGIENLNPACKICNRWKSNYSLEGFRQEITQQVDRARRYSRNFRMAERFGLVEQVERFVTFYFEKL